MWIRWAVFAVICSLVGVASRAAPAAAKQDVEEAWLAVSLNGQQSDDIALFLRTRTGRILAPASQVKTWRLRAPPQAIMTHGGEQYISLDALPGLSYSIDEEKQLLVIKAPARLFEPVALTFSNEDAAHPPESPVGAFFNYDLVGSHVNSQTALTASLEASVFGPAGAGVTEYLVRHESQQNRAIRLTTTWTIDHPETASSLRFCDSITGPSAWGGAVRFGGIQWASNYTTRPGFITMPLPGIGGESALPSTVDVYVNNMLRLQNSLPSGPFHVADVPIITGEGDVRIVVRDLLGRQQIIDQPYYASPELLRGGLQEYSLETGFIRDNFTLTSNDYGRPLVVATDRVGLTDQLTGEVHGELLSEQQTVGFSSSALVATFGVLDASIAGSHSREGNGELVGLGFQRSARGFSLGANVQYASREFLRVGILPYQPSTRLTSQLFASAGLGRYGSLSISRTRSEYYVGHTLDILSARHSINIGWLGYLSFSLVRTVTGTRDTTIALALTHSINARTSLTSTTTSDSGATTTELDLQRNLPAGRGMGYRVIADEGTFQAVDGTLDLQGDAGAYELEAREQSGSTQAQVSATGGLALLGGHVFATRTIQDSFAVVQVGTQSGVRVYRENQLVGQTNSAGYMLVPGLRAYQDNTIGIEQADIPLDRTVNTIQSQAVPYFRSGVLVNFPIEHPNGALLTVQLDSGTLLPAGAVVKVSGVEEEFPTGLNGEVYVTGLKEHNDLRAEWPGGACNFALGYEPSDDPLPRLGPFVCKSAAP
jgi:outer membrane usher protein